MINLKKYDKFLCLEKRLNWEIEINRISELTKWRKNSILTLTNQMVWSGRWILTRLQSMDSRRKDLIMSAQRKNMAIRNKKADNRMHTDVANYMVSWEKFIN